MTSPADSTLMFEKLPLKVQLCGHRGRVRVDVRYYYLHPGTNTLRPSPRGVSIPAWALPEILKALEALKAQMVRDGALELTDPPKFRPDCYPRDF